MSCVSTSARANCRRAYLAGSSRFSGLLWMLITLHGRRPHFLGAEHQVSCGVQPSKSNRRNKVQETGNAALAGAADCNVQEACA